MNYLQAAQLFVRIPLYQITSAADNNRPITPGSMWDRHASIVELFLDVKPGLMTQQDWVALRLQNSLVRDLSLNPHMGVQRGLSLVKRCRSFIRAGDLQ
ncbi:MAG: hypothetical protein NVSMB52_17230 [Chloroflexota bacterium]